MYKKQFAIHGNINMIDLVSQREESKLNMTAQRKEKKPNVLNEINQTILSNFDPRMEVRNSPNCTSIIRLRPTTVDGS